MLNNEAAAAGFIVLGQPAVRTATFSSGWLDIRDYEGQIAIGQAVGTVTGTSPTLDGKIEDADDISGTGAADLSAASFGQVTTSSNMQKLVLDAGRSRGFIRYTGTIGGTSPSFPMAVLLMGRRKYV